MSEATRRWSSLTVDEIIGESGFIADGDWIESKDQDSDGEIRIIQLADIGDGTFLNKSKRFINRASADKLKVTYLKAGDLLMARMPDPIGRVCLFEELQQPCVTVVDIAILRTQKVNSYWLMSSLNSVQVRSEISLKSSGTTRTRIPKREIQELVLDVPPIKEQQKIAEILTSVDEVIENTQSQINKLEDLKMGITDSIFKNLMNKNESKSLARICGEKKDSIVDGPFGSNLKTSDYVKKGVPVLQGQNITNDKFHMRGVRYISEQKANELMRSSIKVGDILTIKIGSVGYSAIVDDLGEYDFAIIPANLLRIRVDSDIADTDFVKQFLVSPIGKKGLRDIASATAQPALSLTSVKQILIPCPSLDDQKRVASSLSSIDIKKSCLCKKMLILENLRSSLMQDLLTGRVRVTVN